MQPRPRLRPQVMKLVYGPPAALLARHPALRQQVSAITFEFPADKVPTVQFTLPNAWHLTLEPWHHILDTWHLTPLAWHLALP